jgi:cobalamin biosynthesis Mg chelatase CobN
MLVLSLLGAALAVTAAAQGAPACAKQVVADWYDNGRVDRVYDLHCYEAAIDSLPVDVRDYSSAREDIQRALQYATQGQTDPGDGAPATSTPTTTTEETTETTTTSSGGGSSSGGSSPPPSTTTKTTTASAPPPPAPTKTAAEAVEPVDTSGPSTVPMPLIILGGLALLLLAAGSAGYIARRMQNRRAGGGDPPATA